MADTPARRLNNRWPNRTIAERFWPNVAKAAPDECWEWKISLGTTGYGSFKVERRTRPARGRDIRSITEFQSGTGPYSTRT